MKFFYGKDFFIDNFSFFKTTMLMKPKKMEKNSIIFQTFFINPKMDILKCPFSRFFDSVEKSFFSLFYYGKKKFLYFINYNTT